LALEAEDRRVEDGAVGRWKCVAAEEPAENSSLSRLVGTI